MRKANKIRATNETTIAVRLDIDGSGNFQIKTGIGFLDHMLELFAFWGHFDLDITTTKADLNVDMHHTNEDVGIVLGQAFDEALGDRKGIQRMANFSVPMEDVLADVAVDINGRGYFGGVRTNQPFMESKEESYSLDYANHFLESFAKATGMTLKVKLGSDLSNPDLHTNLEAVFKALGRALDIATQIDPRRKGVPSTKGVID